MSAKLTKFAALVQEMREAQNRYFRERTPEALSRSKQLERMVDAEAREITDGQGKLFAKD